MEVLSGGVEGAYLNHTFKGSNRHDKIKKNS